MGTSSFRSHLVIGASLVFALILQTIPWPGDLDFMRPAWLFLVTCYWVLALPNRINVGSALVLGLVWDILIGSTLGIRGMMMSLIIYIVALNFLVIRNMALWQQAFVIMFLSALLEWLIFCGEYLNHDVIFNPLTLWSSVINGILWPWVFFLMRRVRRHWHVR